jgi:hypothetical protein
MPKGWPVANNASINVSKRSAAAGIDGHGSMFAFVSRSNQMGVMVSVYALTFSAARSVSATCFAGVGQRPVAFATHGNRYRAVESD